MNWHYVENGQQAGPVTEEQLQQLFQSGRINADTLVWREGMPDWATYHQAVPQSSPPPTIQPLAAGAEATQGESEVACAECGKIFPVSETVKFGKASVCAACKPVFLQKLSEGAKINTSELNYAGFWIRFAAKFIDGLIIGLPFLVAYFSVFFVVVMPGINANRGKSVPVLLNLLPLFIQVGFIFVQMAYQIFFLGKYGATPGKMACKIKVVKSDGEKISYGLATGRFFAEMLSGMTCYIGYIIVAFDEQKRALHDHVCNTRVVYK